MTDDIEETRLVTIALVIIGALVVLPIVFMSIGMMGPGPMMGGMWGGGMWRDGAIPGWVIIAGIVLRLLFVIALIGGCYLIYRTVTRSKQSSDQALQELRLAYARGDLTDEEYERRREVLERDT